MNLSASAAWRQTFRSSLQASVGGGDTGNNVLYHAQPAQTAFTRFSEC